MGWATRQSMRFAIDCADTPHLLALRNRERPRGVHVRCRRIRRLHEGRLKPGLRAEVNVAGAVSAGELAAWLSECFAGCEAVWYIDGVPARGGAHRSSRELQRLVALFAP